MLTIEVKGDVNPSSSLAKAKTGMKTKLTWPLIVLSIAIISCNADLEQNVDKLLTSTNWKMENEQLKKGETSAPLVSYTYHKNGNYTWVVDKNMKITGRWKKTGRNEIYVELKSVILNNNPTDLSGNQGFYVEVLEISASHLKTIERFKVDTPNFDVIKERSYKPV